MRPVRGATALATPPMLLATPTVGSTGSAVRSDPLERLARTPLATAAVFALVPLALFVYWPLGVVVGVAVSLLAVLAIAARSGLIGPAATAGADPVAADDGIDAELADDVRDLRLRLGDDFADFGRAVLHVVEVRRASIVGVQHGLGVSANRSRALLRLLEQEGFVGPAVPRAPREILVDQSLAPELRALLEVAPEPAAR